MFEELRTIYLRGEIDPEAAERTCIELLEMEAKDDARDITLMIDSPGGDVASGFAIIDTMGVVAPDVETICIGMCCSMAALLLAGGAKGKRKSLAHGRIMMHQPLAGGINNAQTTDVQIIARELERQRSECYGYLSQVTGKSVSRIAEDNERDCWMTATEAREYGLIDEIITAKNR